MYHARQRFQQRYDMKLSVELYESMCRAVQSLNKRTGKKIIVTKVAQVTRRRSVYKIRYKNQTIIGVYSSSTHNFVTFLPSNTNLERYKEWEERRRFAHVQEETPIVPEGNCNPAGPRIGEES